MPDKLERISDEKIVQNIDLEDEREYISGGEHLSTINVYPLLDAQLVAVQLIVAEKDKQIEELKKENRQCWENCRELKEQMKGMEQENNRLQNLLKGATLK